MLAVMQTSLKQFFLQSVSITCALDIYYARQPSIWRKLILRLSLETLSMRQLAISPFSWPLGHIFHHHCSASNESQISSVINGQHTISKKNHIICSNIFLLESELLVFVVIANSDAVLPRPQPWWLHLFAVNLVKVKVIKYSFLHLRFIFICSF